MKDPIYPLEDMLPVKQNRFDQAVKVLEEKKALLEKAITKLNECIKERDEALKHKQDKLAQLRAAMDEGQPSSKIDQMKVYKKIVEEKLLEKEKKVQEQQKQVDLAKKQVELATEDMKQKRADLDKIKEHKIEWMKEARAELEQKLTNELDEQGSTTHSSRKLEEKRRSRDY